jgi:flagellar motor switch protein FliN
MKETPKATPAAKPPETPDVLPLLSPRERAHERPLFKLEDLLDLPLQVEVPLDTISVNLRDLAEFTVGSVVKLERNTGESFDIRVNGTLVARGDIRIQGERFAIRVNEVLRTEKLSEVPAEVKRAKVSRS